MKRITLGWVLGTVVSLLLMPAVAQAQAGCTTMPDGTSAGTLSRVSVSSLLVAFG